MLGMLNKKDLAKRWGITVRTLDRWLNKKPIPYTRNLINGQMLFKIEDVEKWEQEVLVGNRD